MRLYSVDATGRHGVVFCSLDASRLAVVLAARMTLGLPYRYSRMRGYLRARDGARELAWTARTRWPGPAGIGSRVVVRVGDPLPTAAPGAEPDAEGENYDAKGGLAAFLTARWGLHTAVLGRTWYLPNVHEPWSLRSLELLLLDDGLLAAAGFGDLAGRPPDHACFAEGVRTRFGSPLVVADRR